MTLRSAYNLFMTPVPRQSSQDMYLLDTNHCSRIIFGDSNLIRQLQEHSSAEVATSVIVRGELLYMVQKSEQQVANLQPVRAFLQTINLYPINGAVADIYGSIKGKIDVKAPMNFDEVSDRLTLT